MTMYVKNEKKGRNLVFYESIGRQVDTTFIFK